MHDFQSLVLLSQHLKTCHLSKNFHSLRIDVFFDQNPGVTDLGETSEH